MKRNGNIYIFIIGLVLVFFTSGCVLHTGYGKIRPQTWRGERVTIQDLQENWQDYTIHYAGLSVNAVAGRTLTGKRWIKVEDQDTLTELIGWMKAYTEYDPQVWRILGPDNEFYGYLYYFGYGNTDVNHAVVKVVDGTTMYMYDLESPVYWTDGGDADRIGLAP
jgi:hypothetical protein